MSQKRGVFRYETWHGMPDMQERGFGRMDV